MREIIITNKKFSLKENVNLVFEKRITKFGNSAKLDVPKKYIGKRAYVIIVDN